MTFNFNRKRSLMAALLATACCLLSVSKAGEPAPRPATSAAAESFVSDARNSVDETELARARGGADTTIVDTSLSSVVGGNTASQVQTGWNVINGGAFANLTGIPVVIQNSGANVAIQNATVIELQFK